MMPIPPSLGYLATSTKKKNIIKEWLNRPCGSNRFLVWRDLKSLGLKEEIKNLVKYDIDSNEYSAWLRLFSLKEITYQELVTEFMLTFEFHPTLKLDDKRMISFKFREKRYRISVADLGVFLELYTRDQVESSFFLDSYRSAPRLPDRKHGNIWQEWAGTNFTCNVKSSTFLSPVHHILHKLLVCSICGKKETSGSVSADELYLMDAIMERKNMNVAYLIAERLEKEKGFEPNKYMYMGPIITKIIKGMGLLSEDHIDEYTVSSSSLPFDLDYCRTIWLISVDEQKQCYWKNSRQIIPGCFLTKKRERSNRTSPEATRERDAADRAKETNAPPEGDGAGTSETHGPSIVSWMDPVTP